MRLLGNALYVIGLIPLTCFSLPLAAGSDSRLVARYGTAESRTVEAFPGTPYMHVGSAGEQPKLVEKFRNGQLAPICGPHPQGLAVYRPTTLVAERSCVGKNYSRLSDGLQLAVGFRPDGSNQCIYPSSNSQAAQTMGWCFFIKVKLQETAGGTKKSSSKSPERKMDLNYILNPQSRTSQGHNRGRPATHGHRSAQKSRTAH